MKEKTFNWLDEISDLESFTTNSGNEDGNDGPNYLDNSDDLIEILNQDKLNSILGG